MNGKQEKYRAILGYSLQISNDEVVIDNVYFYPTAKPSKDLSNNSRLLLATRG